MHNLELYKLVEEELGPERRSILANCFIGALSTFVSEEDWQRALITAKRSVIAIRPELEVPHV